ncbi:MAG: CoA-binding protein [Salipiger marinus]|uniref:CoA-binding protein n=1 Tax=Salipiger marinus TaxID=555512 RepID=UPI004057ECEB
MAQQITRFLDPRSIAVIGGGADSLAVIAALRAMGYVWDIWPVVPGVAKVAGIRARARLSDLPRPPDAAFVGGTGEDAAQALADLARLGAGGAVCPAAQDPAVAQAAGGMPVFAGAVALPAARVLLSPQPTGLLPVPRGVAVLGQLDQDWRGLPVAAVLPRGQGAGTGWLPLGLQLLARDRVSALGLRLDRLGDAQDLLQLGAEAQRLGKPLLVCLPEASLGQRALVTRAGAALVEDEATLVEALRLVHLIGPLPANALAGLGCSGAARDLLAAEAQARDLSFAALSPAQLARMAEDLRGRTPPANPLEAGALLHAEDGLLARLMAEMMAGAAVLTLAALDGAAPGDWARLAAAGAAARDRLGMPVALLSVDAAQMEAPRARALAEAGLIPLAGLGPGLGALRAAIDLGRAPRRVTPLLRPVLPPEGAGVEEISGSVARAALGLAQAGPADPPLLRLMLVAEQATGYVLRLGRSGPVALLPQSVREIAQMAERARRDSAEAKAVAEAVRAVQDYVTAEAGLVAGIEADLCLGRHGAAALADLRIRRWQGDAEAWRRM